MSELSSNIWAVYYFVTDEIKENGKMPTIKQIKSYFTSIDTDTVKEGIKLYKRINKSR